MERPTCSTCRFKAASREERWNDDTDELEPFMRSTCVRIIHGNLSVRDPVTTSVQPAMVVDGSGYSARLLVSDDFGCVLHETAPATPAQEPPR